MHARGNARAPGAPLRESPDGGARIPTRRESYRKPRPLRTAAPRARMLAGAGQVMQRVFGLVHAPGGMESAGD